MLLRYTNTICYNPLPPNTRYPGVGMSIYAHFSMLSVFFKTVKWRNIEMLNLEGDFADKNQLSEIGET